MRLTITAPVFSCMFFVSAMLTVVALSAQAGTPNFSVFDPPPATIAPLPPAALQQAEADADLLAARAAVTAKNGKAATALYEKAIAAGNVVAMVELGNFQDHVSDIGFRVDTQHAKDLYHQAALLGYGLAERQFAKIYEDGDGVAQDETRAVAWYEFAAAQGDDFSNAKLSMCYLRGDGVPKDEAKAMSYAERGERANGVMSRVVLASFYRHGVATAEDDAHAFHLIFLAAEQGYGQAQFDLAQMYRLGIGVAPDPAQARHWARLAWGPGHHLSLDDEWILLPE